MAIQLDEIDLHTRRLYAERGYPWAEWDLLRREAPVYRYERDDVETFWAITRHADVLAISRRPDIFINGGPRLRLIRKGETEPLRGGLDVFGEERGWDPNEPADFVFMDDPRHRNFRLLSSRDFTPGRMRGLALHFDDLAKKFTAEFVEALDAATRESGSCDFVRELAVKLPLAAIGEMMGLPPDDWKKIFEWTNAAVGALHPDDLQPGESLRQASERGTNEFRLYLEALIHERRGAEEAGEAGEGLLDRVLRGEVDGARLNDQQLIGYLLLLIAAGNETTRNATTGAVLALLEHPDQRDRLVANPELLDTAIEEILRWTSPVIQFLRTATQDYALGGETIREGDTVGLFYPSANRDAQAFEDPYVFDVGRTPNSHLAFGHGAHFCLGANLARAELRAVLKALLPVLPRLELAGPPKRVANLHVSGYATLPVRAVDR